MENKILYGKYSDFTFEPFTHKQPIPLESWWVEESSWNGTLTPEQQRASEVYEANREAQANGDEVRWI